MGLVQVPKDAGKTHPYRQKETVEQVNIALNGVVRVNSYDIQSVLRAHNIKALSEYYYQSSVKGSPAQYSQAFVDWLVIHYKGDCAFFEKARRKAKTGR